MSAYAGRKRYVRGMWYIRSDSRPTVAVRAYACPCGRCHRVSMRGPMTVV